MVAAAVVLPLDVHLPKVKDSKQLTSSQRDSCYEEIFACARDVGIGCVEAQDVDRLNILQATFLAMSKAVNAFKSPPDYLLIDGPYKLSLPIAQKGIPKGDQRSLSISAASIVAKVYRDRLMFRYHLSYPAYGFDQNKGYGTKNHRNALHRYGPCPIHRLSFRGVKDNVSKSANATTKR